MDALFMGEVLADLVFSGAKVTMHFGGAPANSAVLASCTGIQTGLVGSIGDDPIGRFLIQTLKHNNVDTRFVQMCDLQSSIATIHLDEAGDPSTILLYRKADAQIKLDVVEDAMRQRPKVFCYGSVSLAHPSSSAALWAAISASYLYDIVTIFDINWRPSLWTDSSLARPLIDAVARNSTVVKGNSREIAWLSSYLGHHATAQSLLHDRTQLVVCTQGNEGCSYYRIDGSEGHLAGYKSTGGDRVGTGDAFTGALCASLATRSVSAIDQIMTADLEQVLDRANWMGGIVASCHGAIPPRNQRTRIKQMFRTSNQR